jgi:nitrogen regulatory protein PII
MKLIIITAVAEFEKEVKQILKKAQVKTYSYREVTGYRNTSEDAIESNWFGTEMNENESIMFYAFVQKENVEMVCESVKQFNSRQETLSHIHTAVLNIEKSN